MSLTLATVVYNEADKIGGLLDHAAGFCDELLVIDQSSKDATAEIAREHGARVVTDVHHGWPEPSRRWIEPNVDTSHILLLDADELIEDDMTHIFGQLAPTYWGAWLWRRTWIDGVWATPDSVDEQFRWWKKGTVLPFSTNLHSYVRPVDDGQVCVVDGWVIAHPKTGAEQTAALKRYEKLMRRGVGCG